MENLTPPLDPPSAKMVIIHLIKEELKNRKLLHNLHKLVFNTFFYEADLTDLIITAIGLRPQTSLDQAFSHSILDRHSQRIVVEDASELHDEAKRVYNILLQHAICHGYAKPEEKQQAPIRSTYESNTCA